MKVSKLQFGIVFLSLALTAFGQSSGTAPGTAASQGSATMATQEQGGTTSGNGAIKVLSPKVNEKLEASIVTLRYQLVNTGLAADPSPTYRLQLDGRDPVETTSSEYNFTGLQPGEHVITIDVVDANHTPVGGSHTEVRFQSANPGAAPPASGQTSSLSPPTVKKAALPLPTGNGTEQLPSAGGELPLLSMVGFGVLAGGMISAMKTRK
jgi:hypothetical protein